MDVVGQLDHNINAGSQELMQLRMQQHDDGQAMLQLEHKLQTRVQSEEVPISQPVFAGPSLHKGNATTHFSYSETMPNLMTTVSLAL